MNIDTPPKAKIEYNFPPVAKKTTIALEEFSPMVATEYHQFKENFIEWLLTEGKNLYRETGFAETTTKTTHYKIDEAYRWKWTHRTKEYTKQFSHDDATALIDFLMKKTSHPERYVDTFEKCIRRLFKYFREELNHDLDEWEHDIPVDGSEGSDDHFKGRFFPEEIDALYEAALNHYSVKSYYNKNMTEDERDALKATLAQRLGIPKTEVGPEEFEESAS